MKQNTMVNLLDEKKIEETIAAAERRTSGEIRVSVAPFFWGSVEKTARKAFERMEMTATRERNGILFFIVPARRRFTVLGDTGIHEKVGQEFWEGLAAAMSRHFRQGEFTQGLVEAIALAGEQLARHFPFDPEKDKNELPDAIDRHLENE